MNMMDAMFGQLPGVRGDARALSDGEIAQIQSAQAVMMANYSPPADYWLMLQNYRPEVVVPQGWADWYEIGDGLA